MKPKLFTIIIINTNKYLNPMLKLEQIDLLDSNDIIIEVMEPIVYTKAGSTIKADDTIAREKANVYYTAAKIVRMSELAENLTPDAHRSLKVGMDVIVPRGSILPIQFPVEGYDSPKLGVINRYTTLAIIKEDI